MINILEAFGDPIGSYAGQSLTGVRDERQMTCPNCGMMPIDGECNCEKEPDVCPHCGMMPINNKCGCLHEAKNKKQKGPSKKTAQKILKGTKSFKDKIKKVSSWADEPEAAAAWMMHKATGKWPSEK